MSVQMDSCCGCGGGGRLSAAVRAQFAWPGHAPFNTPGLALDLSNSRFLTAAITFLDDIGTSITKTITSNNLNGTFVDTITGTDATADGTWTSFGMRSPAWPPDTISSDGTTATWGGGAFQIVLSDLIDAAWCKTKCQALLDSVDLTTLTLGTDSRHVSYDPVFTGSGTDQTPMSISWLSIWVVPGPETPPGSGIFRPTYALGDILGTLYTANGLVGPAVFTPFESVTPAINNIVESADFPPSPGSANLYEQTGYWGMRKSVSDTVSAPVCCEDDYYNYINVTPPSPVCQLISLDGMGHLTLTPPDLTFEQADNAHLVVRTPWFGTALTGGGCPCA